jgi:hypothetical protein
MLIISAKKALFIYINDITTHYMHISFETNNVMPSQTAINNGSMNNQTLSFNEHRLSGPAAICPMRMILLQDMPKTAG